MEKEQVLPKIYSRLVYKVKGSLQKAAIHSTVWYLCEAPVSTGFPHAYGAINLDAHDGTNFQADDCQGSPFITPQDLLGQVTLATTKSSISSEASGNVYFSIGKFRTPWSVQYWL